jgi:hypothetical protein
MLGVGYPVVLFAADIVWTKNARESPAAGPVTATLL